MAIVFGGEDGTFSTSSSGLSPAGGAPGDGWASCRSAQGVLRNADNRTLFPSPVPFFLFLTGDGLCFSADQQWQLYHLEQLAPSGTCLLAWDSRGDFNRGGRARLLIAARQVFMSCHL